MQYFLVSFAIFWVDFATFYDEFQNVRGLFGGFSGHQVKNTTYNDLGILNGKVEEDRSKRS